jgi:APA family basic amino acid/polyamine antiporter
LVIYFGYSRSRSHVGRGLIEVPEPEAYEGLAPSVPGTE